MFIFSAKCRSGTLPVLSWSLLYNYLWDDTDTSFGVVYIVYVSVFKIYKIKCIWQGQYWRGARAQVYEFKRQVVDSIPTRGNKMLIFSFLRSGNEAKRDVEFRHARLPEYGRKWERKYLNISFSVCQDTAWGYKKQKKMYSYNTFYLV